MPGTPRELIQRPHRDSRRTLFRTAFIIMVLGGVGLTLSGCGQDSPSILDPRGPGAERIATLWWWLLSLGTAVFVAVTAALVVAIVRARRPASDAPRDANRFVVVGGIAIPAVVLLVTFGLTMWTTIRLNEADQAALTIEVIGHQF